MVQQAADFLTALIMQTVKLYYDSTIFSITISSQFLLQLVFTQQLYREVKNVVEGKLRLRTHYTNNEYFLNSWLFK